MTDARTYLAGIKERADAATAGPWMSRSDHAVVQVAHSTGEQMTVVAYGPAYHPDAVFIARSRTDLPRVTDALLAVLDLHKVEKRWMPYDGAGISYDTEREALEAAEDVDLGAVAIEEMAEHGTPFFEVCAHCKHIEDSPCEGECTLEAGYRESTWPCPSVKALTKTLEASL